MPSTRFALSVATRKRGTSQRHHRRELGGADVRVKHAFEQADFDLRRTKRPDYYAL